MDGLMNNWSEIAGKAVVESGNRSSSTERDRSKDKLKQIARNHGNIKQKVAY